MPAGSESAGVKTVPEPRIDRAGRIVSIRFFDRMLDRETRRLSRKLQRQIIAAGGKVRLLLAIDTARPGTGPGALFQGLQFLKLHADHIERIALLGRKGRESTYVGLFSLFSGIDMAYFSTDEGIRAVRWLQGDDGRQLTS